MYRGVIPQDEFSLETRLGRVLRDMAVLDGAEDAQSGQQLGNGAEATSEPQ